MPQLPAATAWPQLAAAGGTGTDGSLLVLLLLYYVCAILGRGAGIRTAQAGGKGVSGGRALAGRVRAGKGLAGLRAGEDGEAGERVQTNAA